MRTFLTVLLMAAIGLVTPVLAHPGHFVQGKQHTLILANAVVTNPSWIQVAFFASGPDGFVGSMGSNSLLISRTWPIVPLLKGGDVGIPPNVIL